MPFKSIFGHLQSKKVLCTVTVLLYKKVQDSLLNADVRYCGTGLWLSWEKAKFRLQERPKLCCTCTFAQEWLCTAAPARLESHFHTLAYNIHRTSYIGSQQRNVLNQHMPSGPQIRLFQRGSMLVSSRTARLESRTTKKIFRERDFGSQGIC